MRSVRCMQKMQKGVRGVSTTKALCSAAGIVGRYEDQTEDVAEIRRIEERGGCKLG